MCLLPEPFEERLHVPPEGNKPREMDDSKRRTKEGRDESGRNDSVSGFCRQAYR